MFRPEGGGCSPPETNDAHSNGKMITKYRFGLILALVFLLQLGVIGLFFLLIGLDMEEARRAQLGLMLTQHKALLAAMALMLLVGQGLGLKALFNAYPAPIKRLTEDVVLLAANPSHRLTPQGAREVRALVEKLNALAAVYHALHHDVQAKIGLANRALVEEKNRLAALMSELALSVLVCNIEGRILLYNARARQMLEAGHSAGIATGTAAIGLGRSVFVVLERGLIVHALEQIQHQLCQQDAQMADPVSGFVATLAAGQVVRAHMAPVFDGAHALNGFVLTLEDITRHIEADSRRDALLQAVTQDARAALANILAALETMQSGPEMTGDGRAQLTAIINDESQRLTRHIDRAVQQHGDDGDSRWKLEEMRGADLVALLQRYIDTPALPCSTSGTIDPTLWLKVDSYRLTQALVSLGQRLAGEAGVSELRLGLQRADRLAYLDLVWNGEPLAAEKLRTWENAPMQISVADAVLTLNEVIARHGGETVYRFEKSRRASCYRLLLPLTEPQATLEIPLRQEDRPEFYDFDLFHQPGQNLELDQCLLPQLSYTVFDTETTGLQPDAGDEIISIGALRIVNGRLLQQENFDQLIQPRRTPSVESIGVHGITRAMLEGQPPIETVLPQFCRFAEDTVLVAHNVAFDLRFLQMKEAQTGVSFTQPVLDTLLLSQVIHPNQLRHTLEAIAARLGVAMVGRHTALGDAIVTGEVFLKMIPLLAEKGVLTLSDAREAALKTPYARIHY
jgi:DNA polymerase-3 subunit epsilon